MGYSALPDRLGLVCNGSSKKKFELVIDFKKEILLYSFNDV